MENNFKIANIEQVRLYTDKKGNQKYKYMVHQEKWNKDKKRYDGWECITIYSDNNYDVGYLITYKWKYNPQYQNGRYVEYIAEENLPF